MVKGINRFKENAKPTSGKSTPEMKKTRKNPTKADKNLEKSKKAPVRESPEKGAPLQKDGMTIYPSATRSMEEYDLRPSGGYPAGRSCCCSWKPAARQKESRTGDGDREKENCCSKRRNGKAVGKRKIKIK